MRRIQKPTTRASSRRTLNELVDRVNALSNITATGSVRVIVGSAGVQLIGEKAKAVSTASTSTVIRIFEVQSALDTPSDGIYKCFEQTLDATEWADTAGDDKFDDKDAVEVEVLNLLESNPAATYAAYLSPGDRIAAWQTKDDEGTNRWIGIPIDLGRTRRARTRAAAGAATTIACNLINPRDGLEITSGLGSNITVNFDVAGGGDLNSCIPRIPNDFDITVTNIEGVWYCTTIFQTSEDCVCS